MNSFLSYLELIFKRIKKLSKAVEKGKVNN